MWKLEDLRAKIMSYLCQKCKKKKKKKKNRATNLFLETKRVENYPVFAKLVHVTLHRVKFFLSYHILCHLGSITEQTRTATWNLLGLFEKAAKNCQ